MYELPVHRYRELKHFCLQYHDMKEEVERLSHDGIDKKKEDVTAKTATKLSDLKYAIKLIETTAFDLGKFPGEKILEIVTEDKSIGSVCPDDKVTCEYYVRKFYWMLSVRKGV